MTVHAAAPRSPRSSAGTGEPENPVHYVRDATFDEYRSLTRTGTSAQVMATLRNVATSLERHGGRNPPVS